MYCKSLLGTDVSTVGCTIELLLFHPANAIDVVTNPLFKSSARPRRRNNVSGSTICGYVVPYLNKNMFVLFSINVLTEHVQIVYRKYIEMESIVNDNLLYDLSMKAIMNPNI